MRPYEVMAIFEATTEPTVIQGVLDQALESSAARGGPRRDRPLGQAHLRLRGEPQPRGLLRRRGVHRRAPRRWPTWTACSAWPTRSSATKSSACPTAGHRGRRGSEPAPDESTDERSTRWRPITAWSWWATSPGTPSCASPTPGSQRASFGLAVNRRWQNRQTQEWEEATSFFDVVCWREMAENVSETLTRGARVMVAGRLEQRSWETQEGDKRSKVEVVADEIGPSLRWATAQITKNERRGPGDGPPRRRRNRRPHPSTTTPSSPRRRRRLRIRRGALLMARNNQRGGTTTRRAPKDLGRRVKKKPCALCRDNTEWVDYKDVPMLRKYMSDRGQDPLAPGDRATAPSTSGRWPRPSRRHGSWSCSPTRSAP